MAFRSSSTSTFNGTGTLTATAPAGVQAGDRLLAMIVMDSTVSFTAATGWTSIGTASNSSPDGQSVEFFEKKNATGSDLYNFTSPNTGGCKVVCAAFSGRNNVTAAVLQTTINTTSNATPVSVGLAGVTATALADICCFAQLDQTVQTDVWGFAPPGGYTEREDSNSADWITSTLFTQDAVSAGTTGTLTATATRSSGTGNAGWSGVVINLPAGTAATTFTLMGQNSL
jgi:hypothetical protein